MSDSELLKFPTRFRRQFTKGRGEKVQGLRSSGKKDAQQQSLVKDSRVKGRDYPESFSFETNVCDCMELEIREITGAINETFESHLFASEVRDEA